ncbi:MAG: RnfH family protein [Plesiomonas shigelloides]|uniref:RnfH family protein n=1 Tax=Plesiomonas shigelloides TaxID=703 RepID=UPI001CE2A080|nr:RnfH family protein [Plesiomonas shigelloides]
MAEIHVEVAYALPNVQRVLSLSVLDTATVEEIILRSGILQMCPDIDLRVNRVGVYSRMVKLSDRVHDGDRIEIYRPLLADPKEMRRLRAERAKKNA